MSKNIETKWYDFGEKKFKGIEPLWQFVFREIKATWCFNAKVNKGADAFLKDHITKLAKECRWIATHPLTEELINLYTEDTRNYVAASMAMNPTINAEAVFKLLNLEDLALPHFVAGTVAVEKLEGFEWHGLSQLSASKRHMLLRLLKNPKTPKSIVHKIIESNTDDDILMRALNNKHVPRALFDKLCLVESERVLCEVFRHNEAPADLVERYALSPFSSVRQNIADRANIDPAILRTLCLDTDVRVRAIASNRLKQVQDRLKLSDWCAINLGVSSSRVTVSVSKSVNSFEYMGWLSILGHFFQEVYRTKTGDYIDILLRLNTEKVAANVSSTNALLVDDLFLKEAMRYLSKEEVVSVFTTTWDKESLFAWAKVVKEFQPLIPVIRTELKAELKKQKVLTIHQLTKIIREVVDKKHKESKIASPLALPLNETLKKITNLNLSGTLAGYYVHVPSSLSEVVEIGVQLQNCLDRRFTAFKYAASSNGLVILKNKSNNKPAYVLSVSPEGKILEMKGKLNRMPSLEVIKEMRKVLLDKFANKESSQKGKVGAVHAEN